MKVPIPLNDLDQTIIAIQCSRRALVPLILQYQPIALCFGTGQPLPV